MQQINPDGSFFSDVRPVSRSSVDGEEEMGLSSTRSAFVIPQELGSKRSISSMFPPSATEFSGNGLTSHMQQENVRRTTIPPGTRATVLKNSFLDSGSNAQDKYGPSLTPLTNPSTNGGGSNTLTTIFGGLDIHMSGRAAFLHDSRHQQAGTNFKDDALKGTQDVTRVLQPTISISPHVYPISFERIENILPAEDLALNLLDIYFREIHAYVPILDKADFYRKWLSPERRKMSPFLLLAIFAAAARISDDSRVYARSDDRASKGDLWYEWANNIRSDFHDAPRLDTLQAEIINLKALEDRPNVPGYLYRGWFHLGNVVRMGKDLGLHTSSYKPGKNQNSIMGLRTWQVCSIMDQFMATGQGREFQCDMDDVDLSLLPDASLIDTRMPVEEIRLQNDFVYMAMLVRILRRCSNVHKFVGLKFPFAAEPQRPILSDALLQWRANLPDHLKFHPALDKKLPSHFVGNLHLTYCLTVCLLHRSWIVSVGEYGATGEWRVHLRVCNDAARQATILFEMVLDQFGPAGIKCMIRGYNLSLYGAIIMAMLHAISLTCPEKEFSEGASGYFERAMDFLNRLATFYPNTSLQSHLVTIKNIFAKPRPPAQEGTPFPQDLSPDLVSLRQQYELAQRDLHSNDNGGQANVEMASKYSPYDYSRDYQHQPGHYAATNQFSDVTHHEPRYTSLPMSMSGNVAMDISPVQSSNDSLQMQSPSITHWNPAGLIGAWNLNFPSTSAGMEFANSNGLLNESHLLATTQTPYYSEEQDRCYTHAADQALQQSHYQHY